jgi:hypothetical protein
VDRNGIGREVQWAGCDPRAARGPAEQRIDASQPAPQAIE